MKLLSSSRRELTKVLNKINLYRTVMTETVNEHIHPALRYEKDDIITQEFGDKGLIILNRPKSLNAISRSMSQNLFTVLEEWNSTKRIVVVKGAGDKSFCAGGELKNFYHLLETSSHDEIFKYFSDPLYNDLIKRINKFENSYVTLISGIVVGRGAGISVHGKYRVATETTMFAMPETSIGIFPNAGGNYFLSRLKGNLGLYLGLTGHRLRGRDVKLAGIATHFVSTSKLPELTQALLAPGDVNAEKVLDEFDEKVSEEEFSLAKYSKQIDECFSGDSFDEILSKLKEDGSDWAKSVIETLGKMSPTSLKLTVEVLKRGKRMKSLYDCLEMEHKIECNFVARRASEVAEGIRALIIDRDQKPMWKPKTLDEVSDEYIHSFFDDNKHQRN